MKLTRTPILLSFVAVSLGTSLALARPAQSPILTGPMPMNGAGFGQVEPRTIYLGGDESGLVCRIRWKSWGGAKAIGSGTGWYLSAGQITAYGHWAPARVVLSHLGTWHGRRAYKHLNWTFPTQGRVRGKIAPCTV